MQDARNNAIARNSPDAEYNNSDNGQRDRSPDAYGYTNADAIPTHANSGNPNV
jgi:hypothetical protein